MCDWRFWLVSITAVRGTVSSSSSLPGDGFSAKDMSERLAVVVVCSELVPVCLSVTDWTARERAPLSGTSTTGGRASRLLASFTVTRKHRCHRDVLSSSLEVSIPRDSASPSPGSADRVNMIYIQGMNAWWFLALFNQVGQQTNHLNQVKFACNIETTQQVVKPATAVHTDSCWKLQNSTTYFWCKKS